MVRVTVGRWWRDLTRNDRITRVCAALSLALAFSGAVHLGVFLIDDRPWSGPVSWRKPFTFGLSFGVTLATITWVTSYLRLAPRVRASLLAVFAIDCVVEVADITVQAWRGVPSHLNTSTPLDALIAYTLAAGGAVLVIVLGAFSMGAIRRRVDGPPSMVLAVRAGFVLLMAGLLSGAMMIARGSVEMRTGVPECAYEVAGFLKGVHGLTLHAVLVLPLLACALRKAEVTEVRRYQAVVAALACYVATVLVVLTLDVTR